MKASVNSQINVATTTSNLFGLKASWQMARTPLESLAASYEPISLSEMDNVALLDRTDTKFVLTQLQLLKALHEIRADYRMLEVNGVRLNQYRNLYFDTANFALFHDYVNNRAERYKVRSREYADSHLAFLEVKFKTRKDRTVKDRVRTSDLVTRMTDDATAWLKGVCPLDGATLRPALWNSFKRITLVGKHSQERVTLDVDVEFFDGRRDVFLDGLVIAEVKRDGLSTQSPFLAQMRAMRVMERGFSKYAIGAAMLKDEVKKNALKPKLMMIERMMKDVNTNV